MSRSTALNLALPDDIDDVVRRALAEDVGSGDLTASLIPVTLPVAASVLTRETTVLCGTAWFSEVYAQLDPNVAITWKVDDGAPITPDQEVCTLRGPARSILTGERTALNFLQSLSGTASATKRYVDATRGTSTRILDTRKTLPGLRSAQKYAVRCGGGHNHRMGLHDAILIKENHIIAAGSVQAAVRRAGQVHPGYPVEVEVENLEQFEEALMSGAQTIMLDNFDLRMVKDAVTRRGGAAVKLEVSGSIDIETVHAFAHTGVDYISVGALTKHVRAADFSMRFMTH
jgi:nicotinate-nucleotide pyrophosphorylase (carboxylating)